MMRNAKPVKYGGVWYPSFSALAKAIGTCTSNITQIVQRNGNDLDACGYFGERLIREEGVWYCGEHFKSQRALARHLGVSRNVMQKAVARHGVYLDETKLLPSHSRKCKAVSYCGERFESQKVLARSLGVSEKGVWKAVQEHGNDLDASMIKKASPKKSAGHIPTSSKAVWYCGERFESQAALARHLCVGENVVRYAIKKHGERLDASMIKKASPKKSAGHIPTSSKAVSYCGERFESQKVLARSLGVSEKGVWKAVQEHGNDLDASMFRREKPWFIYRGNRYVGGEILDKFGMTPGEARRLIEAHGHDFDGAGVELRELAPRLSVEDIRMTKIEEEMFYGSKKCKGFS